MTPRRVVALAQALTMIMLLVPGPQSIGPAPVEAALRPADEGPVTVYDAAGKGIGCQSPRERFRAPGLPNDPPWPPGTEPTPAPTPEPTPAPTDAPPEPDPDGDGSPLPEPTEEPSAAAVGYGYVQGTIRPTSKLVAGIDVSHWQGDDIDWRKVRDAGPLFVFMKATERTDHLDRQFVSNIAQARSAGLLVGAYHAFDYRFDGAEQADHFLDTIEPHGGIEGALPPVVDVECFPYLPASIQAVSSARLRDFVERVYERTGRLPVVYTRPDAWAEVTGNADGFSDLPMWTACWYTCEPPLPLAEGWDGWTFWQYTDRERVPGVGRVDGNYFVGTRKELRALKLRPVTVGEGASAVGGGAVELDLGGREGTHVRTALDDGDWSEWKRLRAAAPTVSIPAEEGRHAVRVQLKAAPGLRSPIETVTAVVDATPPEISAPEVALRTGPLGNNGDGLPVSVRWDAVDATAGLSDATVVVRCGPGQRERSESPGGAAPGERVSWDAQAHLLPNASCDVTAISADGAGNTNRATAPSLTTIVQPAAESAIVSGGQVGVIARPGPEAGRMAVLLDGEALGLVDLYAETEEPPAVVFVAELPEGEHTVSVEPTDGGTISVEGFATLEPAA